LLLLNGSFWPIAACRNRL